MHVLWSYVNLALAQEHRATFRAPGNGQYVLYDWKLLFVLRTFRHIQSSWVGSAQPTVASESMRKALNANWINSEVGLQGAEWTDCLPLCFAESCPTEYLNFWVHQCTGMLQILLTLCARDETSFLPSGSSLLVWGL